MSTGRGRLSPAPSGSFSGQDEGAGSSPARPTIPGLTWGNAGPLSSPIAAARLHRLRTAVVERITSHADDDAARLSSERPERRDAWVGPAGPEVTEPGAGEELPKAGGIVSCRGPSRWVIAAASPRPAALTLLCWNREMCRSGPRVSTNHRSMWESVEYAVADVGGERRGPDGEEAVRRRRGVRLRRG
jgi:hypothetical protein